MENSSKIYVDLILWNLRGVFLTENMPFIGAAVVTFMDMLDSINLHPEEDFCHGRRLRLHPRDAAGEE